MPHAVSRLRAASLADDATRPRLDRGDPRVARCAECRLAPTHCMCALRVRAPARAGVCLLMAPFEALKPTNTGWLVADVVADTFAFAWSRTAVDPALTALLADPAWRPVVVFPGEFAAAERVVDAWPRPEDVDVDADARSTASPPDPRPLFILPDGTWSEARKIFRKSPWLDTFPVLSLHPDAASRYRLRRSTHAHHFCTAEVAALCLAQAGDEHAAQAIVATLDVFSERYLSARQSVPANADDEAHRRLREIAARPSAAPGSSPTSPST